jgi:hypothetical protein
MKLNTLLPIYISFSNNPDRFRVDQEGFKLKMFRSAAGCFYNPNIFLKK